MSENSLKEKMEARPEFPAKALITAGMPYGSKDLYFHHVGGMMIHADVFARFLRDRIGADNVIFLSGTDCFGSPAVEGQRKLAEEGRFDGSVRDFVQYNHEEQRKSIAAYDISFDLFAASAVGRAAEIHREMSAYFMRTLYQNGHLRKLSTRQFFDTARGVFLNGRQVVGRCPIAGCQSEEGYADECSLGHQYAPEELINPKSALSGDTPEMREVTNWYFALDEFGALARGWADEWKTRPRSRPFAVKSIEEFLEPPVIYLKRDYLDALGGLALPPYTCRDDGKNKSSAALVFAELAARETACAALSAAGINFRTGKTLVPFRLTGNLDWGVPAPVLEDLDGLTLWVWPESLWAPLSFTQCLLESRGGGADAWREWWTGAGTGVYQFIGQDNIYFYGPVEAAMFAGMQGPDPSPVPGENDLRLPDIIANCHILFLNKKASSSAEIKPPAAREMLNYYTAEQLRAHVLGLGLGLRSVSFQPKPLNPAAKPEDADPVLKEGNLLTNVLNRVARSCFYTAQKYSDGCLPDKAASQEALDMAAETVLDYERLMFRCEFHQIMNLLDTFIRDINKLWSKRMKEADAAEDGGQRTQVLADTFHLLRAAAVLAHPIAPRGTEMLADYFRIPGDVFFSWDRIFDRVEALAGGPGPHGLRFLEPRTDFFRKHESQL